MARFNHPINNFLSGEVSPKILARSETKEYAQACEKLLNMVPQSQGGATRRVGTQFVASQTNSAANKAETRLFQFNISSAESYCIVINRTANGNGWNGIVRAINTSTLSEYAVPCDTTLSGLGYNLHIVADSDLAELQCAQYGDFLFFAQANTHPFYILRTALNTFVMKPVWYPTPNLATYSQPRSMPFQTINTTDIVMTISAVAVGSRTLTIASGTGFAFNASMVAASGFGNYTWFAFIDGGNYGYCFVTAYTSTTQVTVQVTRAMPAALAAAGLTTWYENGWSSYRGFPRSISFYNNRAIYGGNAAFPNIYWGSADSDIFQMTNETNQILVGTATNEMPFRRQLAASENSQIQWTSSGKKITAGTGGREYQIEGQDASTGIGNTNVGSNGETSNGSAYVQPTRLDSAILFVQRSTRKILEYVFDLREDSYTVRDLSTIADHMVLKGLGRFASPATPKFVKIQYAGSDDLIWTLDSNGVLCSITRNRKADTLAWAEHDLGGNFGGENAIVTSMAVCNSGDGTHDDLWVVVKRTINSATVYYIERINNEHVLSNLTNASTSILDKPVYLDSAKLTILGAPGTVFTGFSHLIGQTVSCLADGLYHGEKVVDGSGQITLTAVDATELVAGLKYTSRVVPVVPDVGVQTGSSLGRPKKMDKLAIKFYRTVGAKFLRYADSKTEDIIFRPVNLAANLPIPMYTGFKDIDFPGTWEKDEKFSIETDLPLPMTVLGIYVRGTSND